VADGVEGVLAGTGRRATAALAASEAGVMGSGSGVLEHAASTSNESEVRDRRMAKIGTSRILQADLDAPR